MDGSLVKQQGQVKQQDQEEDLVPIHGVNLVGLVDGWE
jgi:hypothetical protein